MNRAAMRAISGRTDEQLDQLSPEQRQQLATTAALFPDELVDSELGEIPRGWVTHETQKCFEVRDGTHDSPKQANVGYPLVTSRHIISGIIDFSKTYLISPEDYEQVNKRSKVETLDILLTMIGTVGESLLVQQDEINFAIKNVGLFKTSQKPELAYYFYLLLQTSLMKQYLESRMAGTTQKYLTLKELRSISLIFPGDDIIDHFNQIVAPKFKKIHLGNIEIEILANIRDVLLPKLLSGEITLGGIHSTTEVVV